MSVSISFHLIWLIFTISNFLYLIYRCEIVPRIPPERLKDILKKFRELMPKHRASDLFPRRAVELKCQPALATISQIHMKKFSGPNPKQLRCQPASTTIHLIILKTFCELKPKRSIEVPTISLIFLKKFRELMPKPIGLAKTIEPPTG